MGSCVSSLHPNNTNSVSSKIDNQMSSSIPPTPIKDKPITNNNNTDTIVDHHPLPVPVVSFALNSKVSSFNPVSSKRNSLSSNRSFAGRKDEAFCDTQGWLDSDCDDDFYSVNGDFTPSRGNTPVHPSGTPRVSRVYSPQLSRAVFESKLPIRSASNRSGGGTPVRRSFSSAPEDNNNGPISEDVIGAIPNSSSLTAPKTPKKSKKLADLFRESMRERGNVGFTSPLPRKSASRAPSGLRHYSVSSTDKDISVVDDYDSVKEKPAKHGHRCFPRLGCTRSFSESKKTSVEDFEA